MHCSTRLLCPWDSPGRILEWAAISFSRGSSWPRNRTRVACIAGRFFTDWAMMVITFLIYIYLVLCIVHWPPPPPPQLNFHVFLFSEALDHSTVPGTEQKSRKKELICGIEQMTFLFPGFYFFMCKRKGLDHFRLFSKIIISGTVFFQKLSYIEP